MRLPTGNGTWRVIAIALVCVWMGGLSFAEKNNSTKQAVIVTGQDYPGHKWRLTAPVLADVLGSDPRLEVTVVEKPSFLASPELDRYDVVVLHFMDWEQPDPGPEARANLKRFVEQGGGLELVHFACGAFQEWPEFVELAGRVWDPDLRGHDPFGPFTVDIEQPDHPIMRGLKPFTTTDEMYTCLTGDTPIHVLATARSKVDNKRYPMAFVLEYGKGRVFHCPLGHDAGAFSNPAAAELFRRGCAWAAGLPPAPPGRKIVFVAGKPSHNEGAHDWDDDTRLLKKCLEDVVNPSEIRTAVHFDGWPESPGILIGTDALVMLSDGLGGHPLAAEGAMEQARALVEQGCGLVFIHYAVAPPPGAEETFLEWIGGYWDRDYSKNPINKVEVSPATPGHPVCRGWQAYTARDEFYYQLHFRENDDRLTPVLTAMLPRDQPRREIIAWAVERNDGGRGFGFTGGHFHKNWRIDPLRKMVLNAIVWAAHLDVPANGYASVVDAE